MSRWPKYWRVKVTSVQRYYTSKLVYLFPREEGRRLKIPFSLQKVLYTTCVAKVLCCVFLRCNFLLWRSVSSPRKHFFSPFIHSKLHHDSHVRLPSCHFLIIVSATWPVPSCAVCVFRIVLLPLAEWWGCNRWWTANCGSPWCDGRSVQVAPCVGTWHCSEITHRRWRKASEWRVTEIKEFSR